MYKVFGVRHEYFYGGVLTIDILDCNANCIFCFTEREKERKEVTASLDYFIPEDQKQGYQYKIWGRSKNNRPVDDSRSDNDEYALIPADEIAVEICKFANDNGYPKIRISSGEPATNFDDLLAFLDAFSANRTSQLFILETNGKTIGQYPEKAEKLAEYLPWLYIHLSLKTPDKVKYVRCECGSAMNFDHSRNAVDVLADLQFFQENKSHVVFVWDLLEKNDIESIKQDYVSRGIKIEYETIYFYNFINNRIRNAKCDDLFITELDKIYS
ncbi:MAG TPA: radical SAM protein [Candidatus Lokiarchaeia archaeon]|nr:radical SAM protein [Candidatus Lokiarchaeia archaeon]